MTRKEAAMQYFKEGYNCAQSVMLAFMDLLPGDQKTLVSLASAFGGGMGRLREVCGAVTGMFMVTGILYGYDGPETGKPKAELYGRVQELAKEFEKKHGSLLCRDLLGLNVKHDEATPEKRTGEYYKVRPCERIISDAAEMLERYISGHAVTEE